MFFIIMVQDVTYIISLCVDYGPINKITGIFSISPILRAFSSFRFFKQGISGVFISSKRSLVSQCGLFSVIFMSLYGACLSEQVMNILLNISHLGDGPLAL